MKNFVILILIFLFLGSNNFRNAVQPVNDLADIFYSKTLEIYPDYAYYIDSPLKTHSEFYSNKITDIKNWEHFEDSVYIELSKINVSEIIKKTDKITYWILKEKLESNISMRVCKSYLWNVNPFSDWLGIWLDVAEFQPVGSEELRNQAFERWKKFPTFVDTEIDNLKTGISEGYTMPKIIVNRVIDQLQVLIDYDIEESPFMSPAIRDGDNQFQLDWTGLITDKINPSVSKYQKFLRTEYLKIAREEVSILSLPNGNECYQACIRMQTSTNKTGNEIFQLGQQIVSRNKREVIELGNDLYQITDFEKIITEINHDSANYFQTSDEILAFHNQIIANAKEACKNWFNTLPSTDIEIKPYAAHEYGSGAYEGAKGANPAYFRINLNNPEQQQKGDNEQLAIHEVFPGHHLQRGIEKELEGLHPIRKLINFNSYTEGWARYAEQLAEEMGLYKTKTSLITRRAWPARGMVVDPGVHLNNWTMEQAMNYMIESGISESNAENLYYRIILMPAQLTSYDVGGEEIKELRKFAEDNLGQNFDIKEFHTKILENGTIPLNALSSIIQNWIDE